MVWKQYLDSQNCQYSYCSLDYDDDNSGGKSGGVFHTVHRALLIAIFICKMSQFSTALSSDLGCDDDCKRDQEIYFQKACRIGSQCFEALH